MDKRGKNQKSQNKITYMYIFYILYFILYTYIHIQKSATGNDVFLQQKLTFNHANKHPKQPKIRLLLSKICTVGFQSANSRIVQEKAQIFSFPQGFKQLTKTRRTCLVHKSLGAKI